MLIQYQVPVRIAEARALKASGDLVGAEAAFVRSAEALELVDPVAASAAWVEVAKLRLALGAEDGADQALTLAVSVVELRLGPGDPALATPLGVQARLRYIQGRYDEALTLITRAYALVPPDAPVEQASLLFERGKNLDALGRFVEAETAAREGLALRTTHLAPNDPYIADTLNQLANALMAQGRFAEAEPAFRGALAIYEVAYGPDNENVALALSNLGNILRRTGRLEAAEGAYRRAAAIAEGVGDPFLLAQCLTNLGWHLHVTGRGELAEPIFRRALDLAVELVGPDHPFTGVARANLAISLQDQGRHAEAVEIFAVALPVMEAGLGTDSPDLVTALEGYAAALSGLGRRAEAEATHGRARDIIAARLAPGHPEAVRQTGAMAAFLTEQNRPAEALALLRPVRDALFQRAGSGLEGGDPLRRAVPLFAQQVRADWALAEQLSDEGRK